MNKTFISCSGEGCPIKNSCHRFTGSNLHYVEFVEPPMQFTDDWFYCDEFWDNKPEKQLDEIEQFIKQDFERYGEVFQKLADYDTK